MGEPTFINPLFAWVSQCPLEYVTTSCMRRQTAVDLSPNVININAAIQSVTPYTQHMRLVGICVGEEFPVESSLPSNAPFYAMSVVIGTRTRFFLSNPEALASAISQPHSMEKEMPNIWRAIRSLPGIRHLRLEQVKLDKLSATGFDIALFTDLRVSVLYPWKYSDAINPANTLPQAGSQEHRLLEEILLSTPARLRVVFVGSFRVWIVEREKDCQNPLLQVMPLARAKADDEHTKVMQGELTEDDWNFIKSIPPEPIQDLSPDAFETFVSKNKVAWESQPDHIIRERSYLELKRKTEPRG